MKITRNNTVHPRGLDKDKRRIGAGTIARAQKIGPFNRGHLDKILQGLSDEKPVEEAVKDAAPGTGRSRQTTKVKGRIIDALQNRGKDLALAEFDKVKDERQERKQSRIAALSAKAQSPKAIAKTKQSASAVFFGDKINLQNLVAMNGQKVMIFGPCYNGIGTLLLNSIGTKYCHLQVDGVMNNAEWTDSHSLTGHSISLASPTAGSFEPITLSRGGGNDLVQKLLAINGQEVRFNNETGVLEIIPQGSYALVKIGGDYIGDSDEIKGTIEPAN